ncbi:MAG TPA: DsbE family thiol:disulfide interchange protein [Sphingomonadales bacterium]|nr:DsbE family thiol:disulfide interchange protein [Sphingomonadales bacterium]
MKPLYYLPILLFAGLAAALAIGLNLKPGEIPSARVGHAAPEFSLPELFGEGAYSTADLQDGRIKLLNVFASWCEPCRAENALFLALQAQGVIIHALDYKDDPKEAGLFLKGLGNPFERIGVDADGRTGIDFGISGVPETFVIDGEGIILYQHIGPLSEEDVALRILPLLRGRR